MNQRINVVKVDSVPLKEKAFAIREEVFVYEQQVAREEEFDEFEEESHHFVALDDAGKPIGAARWRLTHQGIKLERFVVKKNYRGQGLGSVLVQKVLKDIAEHHPKGSYLYLHAQLDAVPLYAKHAFHKVGERFSECDIEHYKMERSL